jgi:hypothetical protein
LANTFQLTGLSSTALFSKAIVRFFFSWDCFLALKRLQKPLPVSSPGNGATMPKNEVTDLITDQEMVFARLVLSGTMTDRQAAAVAGLKPETAAYTKSKPRVRDYMLEHRAAVQKQLVQQEAEGLHRQSISREQVLARLWEIAKMSPELTRNSVTGQVKALSMIMAIEGLVPDRKQTKSAEPQAVVNVFRAPWVPQRPGESDDDQDESAMPDPPTAAAPEAPPTATLEAIESNVADVSETVTASVPEPTAAVSKKPEVTRYGPFRF